MKKVHCTVTARKSLSSKGAVLLGTLKNLSSSSCRMENSNNMFLKSCPSTALRLSLWWWWIINLICLEGFSDSWKEMPGFDLNFPGSSQSQLPIFLSSQHTITRPCAFYHLPFWISNWEFYLCTPGLHRVHRLNQHIQACSNTEQYPGTAGSCSPQQKCCQCASEELWPDYLRGHAGLWVHIFQWGGICQESSFCLPDKCRACW